MGKQAVWFWLFTVFVIVVGLIIGIGPLQKMVLGWFNEFYLFSKENILTLLAAFFLLKSKFILKIFLKKIFLLSATGLGKRYLIERVFIYHFKVHFLNHIALDLKRLFSHVKKNFMHFPLIKKFIAAFAFLGSLGYIGKFVGIMLVMKVFVAKIWSFLLAVVLNAGTAIVYFFTDYIWGSWLAPVIEVFIFSWLFAWLEKVPFLTKNVRWVYDTGLSLFQCFEAIIGKLFHFPVRRSLQWLLKQTRFLIYKFIGYKRVPVYKQLRELRAFKPNQYHKLMQKRKKRKEKRGKRISIYQKIREKASYGKDKRFNRIGSS